MGVSDSASDLLRRRLGGPPPVNADLDEFCPVTGEFLPPPTEERTVRVVDEHPGATLTMRVREGARERRCSRCHNWWPLSRFTPAKNGAGYHCTCKPCIALWKAEKRAGVDSAAVDAFDLPIVHRIVDANTAPPLRPAAPAAWFSSLTEEPIMNHPALATVPPPQPAKKPRAAPIEFDPLAIELKQRPLPPAVTGVSSRYQALLARMKPGDSIDVAPAIAKGLVSAAKKAKVKLATRVLSETITGVWRL